MQGLAWAVLDQLEQEQDALERAVDELSEEELDDWEDDMDDLLTSLDISDLGACWHCCCLLVH